jgi:hypothetical protein
MSKPNGKSKRSKSFMREGESVQDALARREIENVWTSLAIGIRIVGGVVLWVAYFGCFVHCIRPYVVVDSDLVLRGTPDVIVGLTLAAAAPLIGLWFAHRMTRRAKTSVKYTLGTIFFLVCAATMLALGVGLVLWDYQRIQDAMP